MCSLVSWRGTRIDDVPVFVIRIDQVGWKARSLVLKDESPGKVSGMFCELSSWRQSKEVGNMRVEVDMLRSWREEVAELVCLDVVCKVVFQSGFERSFDTVDSDPSRVLVGRRIAILLILVIRLSRGFLDLLPQIGDGEASSLDSTFRELSIESCFVTVDC